jgi:regulator of sigma E protease
MSTLLVIVSFILVLSPMILIHELGHFWAARWFNIRVEEFGLGFPPRAKTLFVHKGTIFSLNWIPIGGFVRPAGEDDPNSPDGLAAAGKLARAVTLAAGSLANFLLAFLILWGAFLMSRPLYDAGRVAITAVMPGSAAEAAGLQPNDIFVVADGKPIAGDVALLQQTVGSNPNRPITLQIERGGTLQELTITPRPNPDNPATGALGVGLGPWDTGLIERMGADEAARESLATMWMVVSMTVRAPGMLLRGELTTREARPVSVVGISQILGVQAQTGIETGNWFNLIFFAGIISVALGFTNLLPLPALDGGRLLFVLLETIRGRRIAPEREGMVHAFGMMLLLGLMALLIVQDLVNPIFP